MRRAPALALLLAAGCGPGPPPPAPAPPVAPATPLAADPAPAGLSAAALARVHDDLEDATEMVMTRDGRVRRAPEGELDEGLRVLVSDDPAAWGELVASVPSLREALRAVRDHGLPYELPRGTRQGLARVDTWLRSHGVAPVFEAWLALRPPVEVTEAEAARLVEATTLGGWPVCAPGRVGPWLAASLRTAERLHALAIERRAQADHAQANPGHPAMGAEFRKFARAFGGVVRTVDALHPFEAPGGYYIDPTTRRDFAQWLGADTLLRQWLLETVFSLRDEPETRGALAVHATSRIGDLGTLWYGPALDLGFREWLPELPVDPWTALFLGELLERRGSIRRLYEAAGERDRERSLAHFRVALGDPGELGSHDVELRKCLALRRLARAAGTPESLAEFQRFLVGYLPRTALDRRERFLHSILLGLEKIVADPAGCALPAPAIATLGQLAKVCEARPDHDGREEVLVAISRLREIRDACAAGAAR